MNTLDLTGKDVDNNYNPIFDSRKKKIPDNLCPFCCGMGKVSVRTALHQESDDENKEVMCIYCLGKGKIS